MNNEGSKIPEEPAFITEAQRQCLLHVFRNAAAVLEGVIGLVEDRNDKLVPKDLAACLKGFDRVMHSAYSFLEGGTFCTLRDSDCNFVSKFVGCNPKTDKKPKRGLP